MASPIETGYSDTLGLRLLRKLASEGRYIFEVKDARSAASPLGVSDTYLPVLLSRLEDGGWLARLRRGLYAIEGGVPEKVHVHPFAVATHLIPSTVISHWSAMSYHGLTEQIPQGVQAVTTHKVVTPSMRSGAGAPRPTKHAWVIQGIRYEYTTCKPEHVFGVADVWVDQHFRVPITDKERTMLEGFISPRLFGGMGEVLGILEEHVDELDLRKLVAYAQRYGKASVAKRLGWSLEQVGAPEEVLAPLRAMPVSGFRVLDPSRPDGGPYDKRWMIQNNLTATGIQ